jgi:uncharacterized protein (TIGR03086 family)
LEEAVQQPNPVVGQIERALDMTGRVVAEIDDVQWTAPTPCADWDVRDVLNHTVGGMRIFTAELTGQEPGADHEADWLGNDPMGQFADAAAADRSAWGSPDALSGTVTISLGTLPGPMAAVIHLTEVLVHGVDLAVATGQAHLIDEELCADLLATMRAMGVDAYRLPGVFGPEVAAPELAAPHEQLASFLGRDLQRVSAAPR